jgi:hypothetical protein
MPLTFSLSFFSLTINEGVDGETLSSLLIQDLIGIGLKLGPRLKLIKFIELLNKAKWCVPTTPTAEADILTVDNILAIETEHTENQGDANENPCVPKETVVTVYA